MERQPKTRLGQVVSDKMDKTVVVSIETIRRHPIYKKTVKKSENMSLKSKQNVKPGISLKPELSEALDNYATECNMNRRQVLITTAQVRVSSANTLEIYWATHLPTSPLRMGKHDDC